MMNGIAIDKSQRKPVSGYKIDLYRLHQPLLSMGEWKLISSVVTDEDGKFNFRTNESGPYELRWGDDKLASQFLSIDEFDEMKTIYVEIDFSKRIKLDWE